jgi:hypothetical protein
MLKSPYPYFGGKSRVAAAIWDRFGDVPNYVEPFFGSGAVLLARPYPPRLETVNDRNCYLANFWRALQHDPETVAKYADYPVNEADKHARHLWLVNNEEFREKMNTDHTYYDSLVAGWWVWGLCIWIGAGWCDGAVTKQIPHLAKGRGINRGPSRQLPALGAGMGINRQLTAPVCPAEPMVMDADLTVTPARARLLAYMMALAERMRHVRVCCGDWSRIMGPSPTIHNGLTGVFLDPPYAFADSKDRSSVYTFEDGSVAHEVRKWAIENGDNPLLRIALCGYHEHDGAMPDTWERFEWKANGGYGNQGDGLGRENAKRETIYFSPHCLKPMTLFGATVEGEEDAV